MKRDRGQPLRIPATSGSAFWAETNSLRSSKASGAEKWLAKKLLSIAGEPPIAIELWNGEEIRPDKVRPQHKVRVTDRAALLKLCTNPDLELGELYTEGRLTIEGELESFLVAINRALARAGQRNKWAKLVAKLYLLKRNNRLRAKDNIHHHYDLGNEFYSMWLDEHMLYTCAYFPKPDASLEEAQIAKMDHIARKLQLKPGQTVVEAGCGWGALALHFAKQYGVTVKAYNISRAQLAFARQRAAEQGLNHRVDFIERDYREIDQRCDAFVSVGMLEHVGIQQFHDLGAVIDRTLKPHGLGLIHSIGRNRPAPMNAWIERRIFPGAYPPSPSELASIFEPFHYSLIDLENLRLHYSATLRHWLRRFDSKIDNISAGFDERFIRAWRFYLAGSAAAFLSGELQLFQVVFSRFDNNAIPTSREHLYRTD